MRNLRSVFPSCLMAASLSGCATNTSTLRDDLSNAVFVDKVSNGDHSVNVLVDSVDKTGYYVFDGITTNLRNYDKPSQSNFLPEQILAIYELNEEVALVVQGTSSCGNRYEIVGFDRITKKGKGTFIGYCPLDYSFDATSSYIEAVPNDPNGDIIRYSNYSLSGPFHKHTEQLSPPTQAEPASPATRNQPKSNNSNYKLYNVILNYKKEMFYIAHSLCAPFDNCHPSISVDVVGDNVVEDIEWTGSFKKSNYRTVLTFVPFYDGQKISSVKIDVKEENNPPPAFGSSELEKTGAFNLLSYWIKLKASSRTSASADLLIKMADKAISVQQMVCLGIAYLAE